MIDILKLSSEEWFGKILHGETYQGQVLWFDFHIFSERQACSSSRKWWIEGRAAGTDIWGWRADTTTRERAVDSACIARRTQQIEGRVKSMCWTVLHQSVVADDLATQGARTSVAMVLIWISRNILVSASEGLRLAVIFFPVFNGLNFFCRTANISYLILSSSPGRQAEWKIVASVGLR